jgi:hypothetical protein
MFVISHYTHFAPPSPCLSPLHPGKGCPTGGVTPTLLYGYGGFGESHSIHTVVSAVSMTVCTAVAQWIENSHSLLLLIECSLVAYCTKISSLYSPLSLPLSNNHTLIHLDRNFSHTFLCRTGGCWVAREGRVLRQRQHQGRGGVRSSLASGS